MNLLNEVRRRVENSIRIFSKGIHQALDESVGKVIEALKETDLLENSVVLFMSDNGGATEDPMWNFENSASNWPLRGVGILFQNSGEKGISIHEI